MGADSNNITDAKLLAELRASAKQDLDFLTRPGKPERERWVVAEFLTRLNVASRPEEIESLPEQSKVDVRFGDLMFQIKEIPNPGIRRTAEAKEIYERLKVAKTLKDIVGPALAYDLPPLAKVYDLVAKEATVLATDNRYQRVVGEIDLLFYVTRTRASHIRREELDLGHLGSLGWRSISCLAGERATVIFAARNAPVLLRKACLSV